MAQRKPTNYAFTGPSSSRSSPSQATPQRPPLQLQTMARPSPPPTLVHSPLNQQQQRRPFAMPSTPGATPHGSPTTLVPPSARGLRPGGPSPPRMNSNNLVPPKGPPRLKSKNSDQSLNSEHLLGQSSSEKYALGSDPSFWGMNLHTNHPEPDDHIHNPDPKRDRQNDKGGALMSARGLANLGCLVLIAVGIVALFAGYPLITYLTTHHAVTLGGYNLGGINATGQIPVMTGNFALIDKDTPQSAYTQVSYVDGSELQLVFSDEFNVDGRTFYPGDDPYWEAVDLHYWATGNLEWYDPKQLTTADGSLVITLNKTERAFNHNMSYIGGMMTTWNKFCFTGGLLQVSAVMPGSNSVAGLWPAVWTMGNLGRAGYGATLDGMWPYSYDSCDVGTLPNQTMPDGVTPPAALTGGYDGTELSYLPGQRLSACTCPGEPHPGPMMSGGSFRGRSAPEIDVFETQIDETSGTGHVSQSAQFAPFDNQYKWDNSSGNYYLYLPQFQLNSYRGGIWQETTSGVGDINQECFELTGGCYDIYGFEYSPGPTGFITWVAENTASWQVRASGLGPSVDTMIGQRTIPEEPLYLITNLGLSKMFGTVDKANLVFPSTLKIDWIRVYQPKDNINIGCDPDGFPTSSYINQYPEAYTNWEQTTWAQAGHTFPRNNMSTPCN